MRLVYAEGEIAGRTSASTSDPDVEAVVHSIAIVIPVYQGERTLSPLLQEIAPLTLPQRSPHGHSFRVSEVLLVHDGARDRSDRTMRALAERYPFVSLIWLSRNFGQHPATLAGIARTSADWVVTLDEDGQQNPRDIRRLLDRALETGAPLVYARPTNAPPHGWLRNRLSRLAKTISVVVLGNAAVGRFNSFRLISGEVARSLAAYCGPNVYLDSALCWMVDQSQRCDVQLRAEMGRPSGYTFRKLGQRFWRLLLTSGTRPLRLITLIGVASLVLSVLLCCHALWEKLTARVPVQGWTSLIIVICFFSGSILLSLGIMAEYLAATLTLSMGKPLYLVVSRPNRSVPPERPQAMP